MVEIEEKYEKLRRATQFAKWSNKADSTTELPVLDSKRKGWHIPGTSENKRAKLGTKAGESGEGAGSEGDGGGLSKTKQRRLRELRKDATKREKRSKREGRSARDNQENEGKCLIRRPRDVARVCEAIMSSPEQNMELLGALLEHCEKGWDLSARKAKGKRPRTEAVDFPIELSVVSLALVVKDITPGYRISNQIIGLENPESAKDGVNFRKETQRIHAFERSVLDIYKRTCLLLKRILGFGGKNSRVARNKGPILRSVVDLLDATYHFNHHIILLRTIILFLMSGDDGDTYTRSCLSYCSEGLTNILTSDTSLEVGVESVNIIHDILFAKSRRGSGSSFSLTKWILLPFTKYTPWNRIEESRNEFRRIFGPNADSVSKEIIDEIQHTSATRVKVEILVEREEQILKHLFTFYSKALLMDLEELEHVYLGISQYSSRVNLKIRSELIEIIKEKLYNSESLKWNNFTIILKCCFSLLQRGFHLSEQQLEDNSWVLRYLVIRLEKEYSRLRDLAGSTIGKDLRYIDEIESAFRNEFLPTLVINTSIFSSSNSSYLFRLMLIIAQIALVLSRLEKAESSLFLLKLCGQLLIKYPKLKVLLDPEGIPSNDFPIDTNSVLSSWEYQEISLFHILNEFAEDPKADPKLKLACNMLLSESGDTSVKRNAVSLIRRSQNASENSSTASRVVQELRPFYYILKLVNL
ncbi:Nucleolar complex-associated protein 3 [Cryptosporidium felis]|nr:Nucleolar complex-associated protein 3 [Cryptosporidium felis]